MSRIPACFDRLKNNKRTALIPYIAAGDPTLDITVPLMHAMVEAGANIVELGVPFSDPMADGPVIQRATERALVFDTCLDDIFEMVRTFRDRDAHTPVVLMGYLNPIEVMGYQKFVKLAAAAGVDGVLTVDLPPEEATSFVNECKKESINPIFLVAPTTNSKRMALINKFASGFVYYVSIKGVTGAANLDINEVNTRIKTIRKYIRLPLGVGFGIKDADTAALIGECADAIVIGSAIIKIIEQNLVTPSNIITQVSDFIVEIRNALDRELIKS